MGSDPPSWGQAHGDALGGNHLADDLKRAAGTVDVWVVRSEADNAWIGLTATERAGIRSG